MKTKEIPFFNLSNSPYGVLAAPIRQELITSDISKETALPHRHDYYLLILLEKGRLNLTVDFKSESLEPSTAILVRPGQVHQVDSAEDISGWIMLFDPKKVDQTAQFTIEQYMQNTISMNLSPESLRELIQLLSSIHAAIDEKKPGKFHSQFLQSLLNAFFYKTIDVLYLLEADHVKGYPNRALEIAKRFNQLVKNHFRVFKRPSHYAEILNITTSYLNDTLKTVTGFSSTQIIQQELIGEAQRLLFYTSKDVKEIAFELGYKDDKYFIRQFGIITHTTPLNFRKQSTGFR